MGTSEKFCHSTKGEEALRLAVSLSRPYTIDTAMALVYV